MNPTQRWILAVQPGTQTLDDTIARFDAWARASADLPDVVGAEMEVVAPEAHFAHTGRSDLPGFVALLSLWATAGGIDAAVHDAQSHGLGQVEPFAVDTCSLRHAFPRTWTDGEPTPGLKKSTFWRANPDFGPGWRERYARHAAIVRDHHSSAWQYRQNLLGSHGDARGWQAVSELWWPEPAGLLERFYNSPESQQAVREDTVFVGTAMPIVTTHTILRTGTIAVHAAEGSAS